MDVIDRIEAAATRHGDRAAHTYLGDSLSYSRLWSAAAALAARIAGELADDGSPVVVYGHKESAMLVAFLGAVRAAHPYIPLDASWPADRIASVVRFVDWATTLVPEPGRAASDATGHVWLNQAPFSFDLSVMDLYCALTTGATLYSIDASTVANARLLHDELGGSDVSVWVSTPSFADLCLADPGFDASLLPRLRAFLFCGETLSPATAAALLGRFPEAAVVNTYGPTESTVAVTSATIGPEHLDGIAFPVGRAKPGTTILIRDETGAVLPAEQPGEIVLASDTTSIGYLHRPELTGAAFTLVDVDGVATPAYRTGDLGHLDPEGMLHFHGRLDGQIKLHGYRIELEDVETNLRRVTGVQQAAVVAVTADGMATHLRGFVQLSYVPEGGSLATAAALKRELRTYVPEYMVPKLLSVVDRIPMTPNGKADRRALLAVRT